MATTDQATVEALAAPEAMKTIGNHRVHPAARLIPEPSADDYARLTADIAQHGLRVPVVLTPDGQILDGRTRVRTCAELGIPYATRVATINEMLDPTAFVLSMNAARRHLLADQIAAIYFQANAPKVEADQKAAEEAQQAGLRKGTARGVHVAPTGKTAEKIAKATGVSESTVKRVRKVKKVAPGRLADVAAGTVSAMKVLEGIAPSTTESALGDKKATKALLSTEPTIEQPVEAAGSYLGELVMVSSSIIRQIKETVKAKRGVSTKDHEAAVEAVEKLREALETIAPVWKCEECETVLDPGDEPESRYECGECGNGTLRENRCESCNKFAAKVSDVACQMEDCIGEMVRVGWETVIELRAAKAKQEEEEQQRLIASCAAANEFAKTKAGKAEAAKKRADEKTKAAARLKKDEDYTIERASKIVIGRGEGGKTVEQVAREIHERSVEEFEEAAS